LNILLTGGAGYIGSHTAVELLGRGYQVIIADNYSNSNPEVIRRIEKISGIPVLVHDIDVTNINSLDKLFSQYHIDAVIHFAGLKAVGESVKMPLRYYRNNIDSTLSLLEMIDRHNVCNLIFSSSATVYGIPEILPLTENMKVGQCTNPYGWTKLMIEQIIKDHAVANPDFSAVLLRYFNPVGAHPSGLIGENPRGVPNNLMPYVTQVAAGKLKELHIFGSDYPTKDGTGVRDYIHVVDLAKGHIAAIDFCVKHKGVEVFNLGTGVGHSVLDMVNTFISVNHVNVPYCLDKRRPGDIAACYADPTKANGILGWRAELGLKDMCRDTWNWQKNNPNGYDE
jgi:UDP-glucose 4-epimerase